jgi:hypothetical protein
VPIPDGYSGTNFIYFKQKDYSIAFAGASGTLHEFIDRYPDVVDPAHPFGNGYHFGFEITLTSGEISNFSVNGYAQPVGGFAPWEVAVKQCSLPMCGGTNAANGVEANEVRRSADGDEITFSFSGLSGAGAHSAGLELFTNAPASTDPQAIFEDSEGDIFSISVAGPTVSVPESSTWAMLATGFAGIAFLRLRARKGFHSRLHRATF